ncbi:helix-turn-helix domain-containing protein [Allorhizobium borbori]|uniref:HTH cro/C1-type domain-containing protein n=1 Tax=Allorhizobium borbori TaxID=485907 RepID=A0A7W6P193_9HYPH|nr:helix-turn-helix transcriptional regulator [Allorhizobium borbori]MBB4103552.1 hypothetical protein [Allorhizobium borbori]
MSENDFYDAAAKTYVRYVLDELKLSPSALARGAGLSSTTLTRALNDPGHKFTLSTSTLGKIMKFSGINFNPFFEAKDFAEMSMAPFERDDITDESWGPAKPFDPARSEGHVTIVIGHAAAGVWKVPELLKLEKHPPLWVTLPKVNATDAFGLLIDDDSSSPSVERGEYALCLRTKAARTPPAHSDLLVVERWRDGGGLMEITLRRLIEPEGASPYLRFDNMEKYPEVIPYEPDAKDTKVIGVVEWTLRNPTDFKLRAQLLDRRRWSGRI